MTSSIRHVSAFLVAAAFCLSSSLGQALDSWTFLHPGVLYLKRTTEEPKVIHAAFIDIQRSELGVRVTRPAERRLTTSAFSRLTGTLIAINGDFFDKHFQPIGLSIGAGEHWEGTHHSAAMSLFACTKDNRCSIHQEPGRKRTRVAKPAFNPDWTNVVSGKPSLILAGTKRTAQDDRQCGSFCTTPHPRTAIGLTQDKRTVIVVVVEGRRPPVFGMSLSRLASLMAELGAFESFNLDGGGSSSFVIDGRLVSARPENEPFERAVANHLGFARQ